MNLHTAFVNPKHIVILVSYKNQIVYGYMSFVSKMHMPMKRLRHIIVQWHEWSLMFFVEYKAEKVEISYVLLWGNLLAISIFLKQYGIKIYCLLKVRFLIQK
jgi:hypothetical protein